MKISKLSLKPNRTEHKKINSDRVNKIFKQVIKTINLKPFFFFFKRRTENKLNVTLSWI